jgi:hypothetical protein
MRLLTLYRFGMIFGLTLFFCDAALAETLSVREWQNDVKNFQHQVLDVLDQEWSDQPCGEDFGPYILRFLEKIAELKGTVSSKSYLMLREVGVTTGELVTRFETRIPCSVISRWEMMKHYIERQLELVGNLLAILE